MPQDEDIDTVAVVHSSPHHPTANPIAGGARPRR